MKKTALFSITALILLMPAILFAQVAVAVLPFEGTAPAAEKLFTQYLIKGGQIQAVSDSAMKNILSIHERAQLQGSSLHDISKLKLAEFIITGSAANGTITITAVDVNTSVIVFTKSTPFDNAKADYVYRSLASACRDAVLSSISGSDREPPDEAKPYLQVLNSLIKSLGSPDEASFPYFAVYSKGNYIHPDPENKSSAEKGKQFLKYFRPYFIRGKATFLSMEKKSGNVLITCIVDKAGSKTKHIVGFVELDDGSIALLDELHKIIK